MKKLYVIVLLLVGLASSKAQESPDQRINILTPNAESFKIYGDIPVSLYTGIPQVGIPLHTIQTEHSNIDISINYHASGFKPESHPSWVGLGWNLSVGGVISREIKGELDEMKSDNYAHNGLGFYYSYNVLNKEKWYQPGVAGATNSDFGFRNMDIDTQPDIFSFNFLGYSGKFYLNHLGEWKVQCDAPVKVIFNKDDMGHDGSMFMSNHFRKFTIIDEKGVKYIFGGENAIEYSQNMFTNKFISYSYAQGWQAVSWYLKEIIPPVGEPVYFNYERGPYQSAFSCMGRNKPQKRGSQNTIYDYVLGDYINGGVSGSVISPVYLTSIDCPSKNLIISFETSKSNDLIYPETNYRDFFYTNNSIPDPTFLAFDAVANIPYFNRNPSDKNKASLSTGLGLFKDRFIWLKLDKIVLKYKNNNSERVSKNIQFFYDERANIRRKLSSISTSCPSSNDPEVYSFEYNQSLPYNMVAEPEYLSEYGDHWGYANNKFMWKEEDRGNNPKSPVKERAKLGVLSKIIYPTKGYTMFVYENHDYSAYIPINATYLGETSPTITGGLRIKKILNVSNSREFTSREYLYNRINRVGISSGILHARLPYYTSSGLLFDNSGAHVTYSSVLEKYENGSFKATHFVTQAGGQRLGESINPVFDDLPVYLTGDLVDVPYSRRDMERGKVSDEYYCDSLGKVYKSTHYSYTNIGKAASNYVRTLDPMYMGKAFYNPDELWGTSRLVKGASAYYYYCYSNKLSSVREIQYNKNSTFTYGNTSMPSSNDMVLSSKIMEYDSNKQLIKESILNSDGKTNQTITKYPYTEQGLDVHAKMFENNMLAYPVSQKRYANNIFDKGTEYNYSFLNNKHILLTSTKDIYGDKSLVTNEYKYNSIGKLIEAKDYQGLYQTYLWDYKGRKVKVILDNINIDGIKNIVTSEVINCTSVNTDWTVLTKKLRDTYSAPFIKSYDYNYNGTIDKITDATSLSSYFTYDNNERLKAVLNHQQDTVQRYSYNYKKENITGSVYLNDFITLSATKKCPAGYISDGKSSKLDFPSGIYISTISKEDANKKVWDNHMQEVQAIADAEGNCIRYQDIALSNTPNTNIMTYRASVEGDELILGYIYMSWTDAFRYSSPSVFKSSVAIGQIKDKEFIPQKTTFREYEMYGNIWTIWTEPSGYINIRVSQEKNLWQIPQWSDGFQVSGEFRFPLK